MKQLVVVAASLALFVACGKKSDEDSESGSRRGKKGSAFKSTGSVDEPVAEPGVDEPPPPPVAPAVEPHAAAPAPSYPGLGERAARLCARSAECRCPDAGACAETYAKFQDAIPEGMWRCIEGLAPDCDAFCSEERGNECIAPYTEEFQRNLRQTAWPRYCRRRTACSCPVAECETDPAPTEDWHNDVFNCASVLSCPDVCTSIVEQGSASNDKCVAPIIEARQRAQAPQGGGGVCRSMNEGAGTSCTGGGVYGQGSCPACSINICCAAGGGPARAGARGVCTQAAICNMPRR